MSSLTSIMKLLASSCLASILVAARTTLSPRCDSSPYGSSEIGYKILTAAADDLFILDFKPYTSPPSLEKIYCWPGAIPNGSLPWITRHPADSNLFVVANDNHDYGQISTFRYHAGNDTLSLLDRVDPLGSCAHIAISPDGTTVHVANLYANEEMGPNGALIPLDVTTGEFGQVSVPSFLNFSNYELQPDQISELQLQRHPHHWAFHPFLPVAYLSDLGADLVRRYHINGPGDLTPLDPIPHKIASGPRHTVIHPSGRALYTIHEISSTISVGSIDIDTLYGNVTISQPAVSIIQSWADHTPNVFMGSELQLTDDGRFLYTASRNNTAPPAGGDNSDPIALFSVSPNGTYIELLQFFSSDVWYLRYFGISPSYFDQTRRAQRYLIAGGQYSNDTTIFERDVISGGLTKIAHWSYEKPITSYVWL